MDEPLTVWAKMLGRLAAVLLAIGIAPAILVQTLFTDIDGLIPFLFLFGVAPLGLVCLVVSITLFLAALARRKRRNPS